jgi:hypothetical protein
MKANSIVKSEISINKLDEKQDVKIIMKNDKPPKKLNKAMLPIPLNFFQSYFLQSTITRTHTKKD